MLRIQRFTSSSGGGGGSVRLQFFFFNKVFTFSGSNSPPPVTVMAAASSSSYSSLGRSDPSFFKGFHTDSMARVPYSSNVFRMMTMNKNDGKDLGLTIRSCLDSSSTRNWRAPPRALAPLHLLVRDSDVILEDTNTSTSTGNSTTVNGSSLVNGHWVCQGGKPIGFPDSTLTDKMVVAVDVDEVLGNFVSALNRFIADRYSSNHSVSEYHVYEFFKIWKCSRDEADIRVHEFFKTPYFKTGIHPLPGAQRALHNLSRLCKLSVVTSRQNVIKDHTIEWIEKHYPRVFQEIHFGNHFALNGESRPKSEICRSLGAKVLIDDNPRYAIECADVGIRVLLFDYENSYPWCKTRAVDQHPLVTKVHNWEQVEQQLVSWTVN